VVGVEIHQVVSSIDGDSLDLGVESGQTILFRVSVSVQLQNIHLESISITCGYCFVADVSSGKCVLVHKQINADS